jgi:hypothetical protein
MRTTLLYRIVFFLAVFACSEASACSAPTWQPLQKLDSYAYIFVGEVVGVRLDEIIDFEMRDRNPDDLNREDPQDWPYGGIGIYSDSTMMHSIEVLPSRPLKGKPPLLLTVKAGGCRFGEAQVRMTGLFFVKSDRTAEVVYEADRRRFDPLLKKVDKCTKQACTDEELER